MSACDPVYVIVKHFKCTLVSNTDVKLTLLKVHRFLLVKGAISHFINETGSYNMLCYIQSLQKIFNPHFS